MDELKQLYVTSLRESPTNPRKHFPPASIAELAESAKQVGIVEPLVVRLIEDEAPLVYEIVCGARRYRASIVAGLETLPCIVRELTDDQVLDIQITENLQREDISPLDECDAFKVLMEKRHLNLEAVAIKFGKSTDYIYSRIKLSNLINEGRKLLEDNVLPVSAAIKMAYLTEKQQTLAFKRVISTVQINGQSKQIFSGLKDLKYFFDSNILLSLASADFETNDAQLFPEAGPCTTCIKRTGNSLYKEIADSDKCLDSDCFFQKSCLHYQRLKTIADQVNKKPAVFIARQFGAEKQFSEMGGEVYGKEQYHVLPPNQVKNNKNAIPAIFVGSQFTLDGEKKESSDIVYIELIKPKKKEVIPVHVDEKMQTGAEKVLKDEALQKEFEKLAFQEFGQINKGKIIHKNLLYWMLANLLYFVGENHLKSLVIKYNLVLPTESGIKVNAGFDFKKNYEFNTGDLYKALLLKPWKTGEVERFFNDMVFIREVDDDNTFPLIAKAIGLDIKKLRKAAEASLKKQK